MIVLVINAGSSSLKYQLFNMDDESVMAKGACERIGIGGHLKHTPRVGGKPAFEADLELPSHAEAIAAVIEKLISKEYGVIRSMKEIDAVGHRVVHGGEAFTGSALITDELVRVLNDCTQLAPLHNPANIMGIEACKKVMGNIPQVAVFDTAFHHTMPAKAYIYAIPWEYYVNDKVRRYGFHGTSHRYISLKAAEMLGRPVEELKLISCHMGNGSSICAIDGGKSIDTSMGFTPLVGLPMGTRCGQMDMGAVQYLMKKYEYSIDEMLNILNKKSGMLGISGVSSDFRDLDEAAEHGDERSQLALDMFHYWVAKTVGGYVAAMDGVDAIIFTAGIGENNWHTRMEVSKYFGYLGANLDHEANKVNNGKQAFISTKDSKVALMIIPTDEELVIARDTREIVSSIA